MQKKTVLQGITLWFNLISLLLECSQALYKLFFMLYFYFLFIYFFNFLFFPFFFFFAHNFVFLFFLFYKWTLHVPNYYKLNLGAHMPVYGHPENPYVLNHMITEGECTW